MLVVRNICLKQVMARSGSIRLDTPSGLEALFSLCVNNRVKASSWQLIFNIATSDLGQRGLNKNKT